MLADAARSAAKTLCGTPACLILPEQPTEMERCLCSISALNPFSAARLAAIGCTVQDLLTLDHGDQVCDGPHCCAYEQCVLIISRANLHSSGCISCTWTACGIDGWL